MAHKLVVGTTLSGKSTLVKKMAADAEKRGIAVVVYDPTLSDWSDDADVTDCPIEFRNIIIEYINKKRPIFAVIDEADTMLSQGDRENWWIFTRGRHYGIEACAITQRPKLVAVTVRGQCHEIYAFRLSRTDLQDLEIETACEGLMQAANFRQGEFVYSHWKDGQKVVDRAKVF